MAENTDYINTLSEALKIRSEWLDKSELPKLKEALRSYQTGFASLYNLFLKKKLINEDPYKQEVKIGELEVPESGSFIEAKKHDQISLRLSNYDTQMDFLVNFYQFSPDFLTLDRLKRIVNLVKYIDWLHLTPDSEQPNTKIVAEMTTQVKQGVDNLTMSVISESLVNLSKQYTPVMGHLKTLVDYRREFYKLELREKVFSTMPHAEATQLIQVKKKFSHVNFGQPFYPDLAEEVIKEDYSQEGSKLRERVLDSLKVAEEKPKIVKPKVDFKSILLDGIQNLGSSGQIIMDIMTKVEFNQSVMESRKKSIFEQIKLLLQQMLNKEPEATIYEVEYMDPIKNVRIHEKININIFKNDLLKKIKMLNTMNIRNSPGMVKLEALQDEQLISFLEKNIRELQNLHKLLEALDEYFKTEVTREDRDKIRGIKPELATVKNVIVRANSKRHEYNAQKEEDEQLRKLGVKPGA